MFLETVINFPDWALEYITTHYYEDGVEVITHGFNEQKINTLVYEQELAIVLKDGTKIDIEFDRQNFSFKADHLSGKTQITSWHILDGGFKIEDVSDVIIFGVSFGLEEDG